MIALVSTSIQTCLLIALCILYRCASAVGWLNDICVATKGLAEESVTEIIVQEVFVALICLLIMMINALYCINALICVPKKVLKHYAL